MEWGHARYEHQSMVFESVSGPDFQQLRFHDPLAGSCIDIEVRSIMQEEEYRNLDAAQQTLRKTLEYTSKWLAGSEEAACEVVGQLNSTPALAKQAHWGEHFVRSADRFENLKETYSKLHELHCRNLELLRHADTNITQWGGCIAHSMCLRSKYSGFRDRAAVIAGHYRRLQQLHESV